MTVREITIEGGERITADDVLHMIDVRVGDRVVGTDVHAAAARLNRHPWIRSAAVSLHFRDLHVSIQERQPFALAHLSDGRLVWCDPSGFVLEAASPAGGPAGDAGENAWVVEGLGTVHETDDGPRLGDDGQWEIVRLVAHSALVRRLEAASGAGLRIRFSAGGVDLVAQGGPRIRLPMSNTGVALHRLDDVWPTFEKWVSLQSLDLRLPGELVVAGSAD